MILRWTLCSLAIVITSGRFYLRWRYSKTARLDDVFNGLALICLVGFSATQVTPGATVLTTSILQTTMAEFLLLWTTLYLVKASFLALCWYIFHISATFRKAWWIVTVYTLLTYWPIVITQLWQCGDPSNWADPSACTAHLLPSGLWKDMAPAVACHAALHATSESLILALPLRFISQLQMSRAQKISVSAVFAIIVVDIATGVLRNIASMCMILEYNVETSIEISGYMLDLEPGIAVTVCALPSYGVLFKRRKKRRNERDDRGRDQVEGGQETSSKLIPAETFDLEDLAIKEPDMVSVVRLKEQSYSIAP